MSNTPKLALIGAGHMGGALLRAWLDDPDHINPRELLIIDPKPGPVAKAAIAQGATITKTLMAASAAALETLVLAVKPQMLAAATKGFAELLPPGTLAVSVLAGPRIAALTEALGERPIIRVMPNTPAAIGQGVAVFACSASVSETQRQAVRRLLAGCGLVEEVENEAMLDAVTAVSGSGPAYVFLLAEALAAAAEAEGLPADMAERLARATVSGAGALLTASDDAPRTLREAVTSPGGTTEAAMDVLTARGGLPDALRHAVAAATRRAAQLGR